MNREAGIATWLASRWFIVPAVFAVVTIGWLAYVGAHDNGLIEGRVVDATGKPVAGATVQLFERDFVTHEERGRATTDAEGRFRFTDNRSHSIQLEAEAPGPRAHRSPDTAAVVRRAGHGARPSRCAFPPPREIR